MIRLSGALAVLAFLSLEGDGRISTAPTPLQRRDSAAVINHARASAEVFVQDWRYNWELGETNRHNSPYCPDKCDHIWTWGNPGGVPSASLSARQGGVLWQEWLHADAKGLDTLPRLDLIHCHVEGSASRTGGASQSDAAAGFTEIPQPSAAWGVNPHIIASALSQRAICPSWYPPAFFPTAMVPLWDERTGIDASIATPLRRHITTARAKLLTELAQAATAFPGDGWVTGQRVRFLLDQLDVAGAAKAAAACHAEAWWCSALSAYVGYVQRNWLGAELRFDKMLTQMPDSLRCAWTDLGTLLEADERSAYAEVPCQNRDSLNTRIWWLADPLYTEDGNERRVEHFARQTLIALRKGTSYNERWDMRLEPKSGGDAVAEMLVRYGWPSVSSWGGFLEDSSHYAAGTGHLDLLGWRAMTEHGRFATAEYGGPRFHTVPTWEAIEHPTTAEPTAWTLTADADTTFNPGADWWWPGEHYARAAGPIVQLIEDQIALFRRQDSVLLATATNLRLQDFGFPPRADTLRGSLVLSTGPDSMRFKPARGPVGGVALVTSMVPPRPQLVSVELRGRTPTGVTARIRFGIEPPPPLSTMRPGDLAISEPVLIRAAALDEIPATDATAALSRMYGTAVFKNVPRIGIYWETYGLTDRDTVDITVRIERRQSGILRRLFARVGIGQAASAVEFSWREPELGRAVTTIPGPIPIQGRNVSLDLTQLDPGDYTLVVGMIRPGGVPITAAREFRIARD